MTECNQSQFEFEAHFSRRVVSCFSDARDPQRIEHALSEMLAQRIYGLALGYEDLNDHEELRNDPLLGMLTGRRDLDTPLAGKSTLNRLELTPAGSPAAERYNKITYSSEALAGAKGVFLILVVFSRSRFTSRVGDTVAHQ